MDRVEQSKRSRRVRERTTVVRRKFGLRLQRTTGGREREKKLD